MRDRSGTDPARTEFDLDTLSAELLRVVNQTSVKSPQGRTTRWRQLARMRSTCPPPGEPALLVT
jgi:hypothetical protein